MSSINCDTIARAGMLLRVRVRINPIADRGGVGFTVPDRLWTEMLHRFNSGAC